MPSSTSCLALSSLAIGAVICYVQHTDSRLYFAGLFAALWLSQLCVLAVYKVIIRPSFLSPLRYLPQPTTRHWLFGHASTLLQRPLPLIREWVAKTPNQGLIRVLWFFNQERILITSPKALAEVLTTKCYAFKKPDAVINTSRRILGYSLLLADGDEHKSQRRNLMPAFAFRHIKDLYPIFWQKSREVVQAMTAQCNSREVTEMDIGQWASRCTLDILGTAGLGCDFGAIQSTNVELVKTYTKLFRPSVGSPLLAILGLFLPTWLVNKLPFGSNLEISAAVTTIRNVCKDLIQEKRIKIANKQMLDVDILSVALESGQFSDEQLVDQLMTFLAAGHESTATSMIWAVYMLCRHPDMQKRLRDEVRATLPSTDEDININSLDIDHMPYLKAFCSEVLRYWSPVPMTVREAICDTTIMGQVVPAGTEVMISPWATNMDPNLWGPDAHEFNPDRWLPTEDPASVNLAAAGNAASNYAFLTFLHGPRSCIGQSFSRAEFACLLAAWTGRFEFALANDELHDEDKLDIKVGATAKPKDGLHCKVKVVEGY